MEGLKQFDVCHNPDPASRADIPFVAILQSDYVMGLGSVVVAPLRRHGTHLPIAGLSLEVVLGGKPHLMNVHELATLQRRRLKPCGTSVSHLREKIVAAIDSLFTGI